MSSSSAAETKTMSQFFPFSKPREGQKQAMKEIEDAIKCGYTMIIGEYPTGFGKSPLAIALARYMSTSFILTATIDLQHQYTRDFPFLQEGKGRRNFECPEIARMMKENPKVGFLEKHCGAGPCRTEKEYPCSFKPFLLQYEVDNRGTVDEKVRLNAVASKEYLLKSPCGYFDAKWKSVLGSHSVFNYKYFLDNAFAQAFKPRDIMIMDEAHLLEEELTEHQGFNLQLKRIKKFSENPREVEIPDDIGMDDIDEWRHFLTDIYYDIDTFIGIAESQGTKAGTRFTAENLLMASEDKTKLERMIDSIRDYPKNWIVTRIDKGYDEEEKPSVKFGQSSMFDYGYQKPSYNSSGPKKVTKVQFKPLDVSGLAKFIFRFGKVNFMMSATILGKNEFCDTFKLEYDKVKFFQLPSEFPIANRPIYPLNVGKLNAGNFDQEIPNFVRVIEKIMNKYSNQKGIIHCTSYKQVQYIREHLSEYNRKRLIETGDDVPREEVLRRHAESPNPTVLLSPSLHTGVDLKDDQCRFQVILKIPYPDLTDRLIAARKDRNPQWYNWRTALTLVQAYGRGVRHKDDYADTYILDSHFTGFFMKMNYKLLPRWFLQAIRSANVVL